MADLESSSFENVHCRECGKVVEQCYPRRGRPRLWCPDHSKRVVEKTTKTCVVCGSGFLGGSRAKCCSPQCSRVRDNWRRNENRKPRGPFTCKNCGKEYYKKPSRNNKDGNIYCSRSCAFEDRKSWAKGPLAAPRTALPEYSRLKICAGCQESVVKPGVKLCRSCKGTVEALRNWGECAHCRSVFERKEKYQLMCSEECREASALKTRQKMRKLRGSGRSRSRARYFGVAYEYINVVRVFARDGWKCQICGVSTPKSRRGTKHFNAPELDHIIPISKGGGHLYSNVQCACKRCNAEKTDSLTHPQQTSLFTALRPAEMGAGGR